jgi:hypothetical protein
MDHAHSKKQDRPLQRTYFLLLRATTADWCDIGRVTIDILPDDVLLDIFDHYLAEAAEYLCDAWAWQVLVHVCQKWRFVVFRSPLRLNLRIPCSARTPVREKLAVWPSLPYLPIIVAEYRFSTSSTTAKWDNIIAALEYNDRVCEIDLRISSSLLESVFGEMKKTFVALKHLSLYAIGDRAPVVSDLFLGGSAPHLRYLSLTRIPFTSPALRELPLFAPNLVILSIRDIPHSGYFSPEAMVTCLSALTRLKHLSIGFESPPSRPPREGRHPPPTRSVLPALTNLTCIGVSEYLEDLISRIDPPLLTRLHITFFYQVIFDTPQLVQFITCAPKFKAYDEARVIFSTSGSSIALLGGDSDNAGLKLEILGFDLEILSRSRLSSLAQVQTSSFPQALISTVKHLYILEAQYSPSLWQYALEDNRWLEFFHPFTAVKNLYLSRKFVPRILPTLPELGERVIEVLPNLQSLFLEGLVEPRLVPIRLPKAMQEFIAARQLSSRPIAISDWDWDTWLGVYR